MRRPLKGNLEAQARQSMPTGGQRGAIHDTHISSQLITGHFRPFQAISGHSRPSQAVPGHPRPSWAITGHHGLSPAARREGSEHRSSSRRMAATRHSSCPPPRQARAAPARRSLASLPQRRSPHRVRMRARWPCSAGRRRELRVAAQRQLVGGTGCREEAVDANQCQSVPMKPRGGNREAAGRQSREAITCRYAPSSASKSEAARRRGQWLRGSSTTCE